MVPITVGVAAPRGSIAYDSLARTLLATRGVYAVVGVNPERGDFDANRGISVIVGMVLDRTGAGWIRELRGAGEITPVIAVCRPSAARAAVAAGAVGILYLDDDRLDLERALATCARGGRWVPAELERAEEPVGVMGEAEEADPSEVAAIVKLARSRASA